MNNFDFLQSGNSATTTATIITTTTTTTTIDSLSFLPLHNRLSKEQSKLLFFCRFSQLIFLCFEWIRCATSQTVPGSISGGVTGDFFSGSFQQNHVPWGRRSLWKWVPGIYPGVKAAGAYGWRPTTIVVPNVEMMWGLNLPGTPRATSASSRDTFPFFN